MGNYHQNRVRVNFHFCGNGERVIPIYAWWRAQSWVAPPLLGYVGREGLVLVNPVQFTCIFPWDLCAWDTAQLYLVVNHTPCYCVVWGGIDVLYVYIHSFVLFLVVWSRKYFWLSYEYIIHLLLCRALGYIIVIPHTDGKHSSPILPAV